MEKQNSNFDAEERAKLILSLFSRAQDNEDEDEEDDNSGCIAALLEAPSQSSSRNVIPRRSASQQSTDFRPL